MDKCTRCGQNFDNFKIKIELKFNAARKKNNETWEDLPNLNLYTSEVLCEDCFNKLSELYAQMNIKRS